MGLLVELNVDSMSMKREIFGAVIIFLVYRLQVSVCGPFVMKEIHQINDYMPTWVEMGLSPADKRADNYHFYTSGYQMISPSVGYF